MTVDDGSAVPTDAPRSGRRPVCEGDGLNVPASDALTCRAAHRLHETHVAWARTAIDRRPEQCYQCHASARIVLGEVRVGDGRLVPQPTFDAVRRNVDVALLSPLTEFRPRQELADDIARAVMLLFESYPVAETSQAGGPSPAGDGGGAVPDA